MTAQSEGPAAAARAMTRYDTRLIAVVPREISMRLRLLAAVRGRPISHVLTDLLTQALMDNPEVAAELAEQLRQIGAPDDNQG